MSHPLIRWKGWLSPGGKRTAGNGIAAMTPADLAKKLFDARYTEAVITFTGGGETRQVGGVGEINGRRSHWGEESAA